MSISPTPPHNLLTDKELVKQVLDHHKDSYSIIVHRYQDKLLRYLNHFTNYQNDLAHDAVQNAFIKAYQNLNEYNHKYEFSSWLYRIAHNEAVSFLRKEKNIYHGEIEHLPELVAHLDFVSDLIKKEELEKLSIALNKLNFKQKQVLILYYLEEESYQEIAQIMQTNKNTVASDLKRAKSKLAKYMNYN